MDCNLEGRLKKCHLAPKKGLWPLFEAIVNSLHAIEDRKVDGRVAIHIVRDDFPGQIPEADAQRLIKDFVITDNGIGFTAENYASFGTSDSTYKLNRGGKGIGRLLWLVAFDSVVIESIYASDKELWQRKFEFQVSHNGPKEISHAKIETGDVGTTVRLVGFKPEYRDAVGADIKTISAAVLEHCLQYFLYDGCPTITVSDDDSPEKVVVNDFYSETIGKSRTTKAFAIGTQNFRIDHLRSNGHGPQEHSMHFCAHKRSVVRKRLGKEIPNLGSKLAGENGDGIVYTGYLSGEFLDQTVNPERTGFRFPEEDDTLFKENLTEDAVSKAAVEQVEKELEPFLSKSREDLQARVTRVITEEMPEARALLRSVNTLVRTLSPTADDRALRRRINEAGFAHEIEVRESVSDLMENLGKENPNIEKAKAAAETILADVTETSRGKLAGYVAFRKAVLQIYEKQIGVQSTGKFSREDAVHDIIFPRRSTSEDKAFDDHNLWIVDDRLAFHQLLASDVPFDEIKSVEINGKDRCDLLIVNKPAAFANTSEEVSSVVIVELKRPQRNDYDGNDNPIDQVLEYIEEIRAGRARKTDGRHLVISNDSPFFVYIISDITAALKTIINRRGIFTPTPDAQGFFGYAKEHKAYMEILSFEKLIADAKKRNRVWFKKLGIE